jgi:signal transduction histidine kinase
VNRETTERLTELAQEGRSALEVRHGRVKIDSDALQLVSAATESISYVDARGVLVTRIGSLDPSRAGSMTRTAPAPALSLHGAGVPAQIAVAIDLQRSHRLVRRVDLGLAIGLIVALALAGVGGRILAGRSIARVVATVRTLRDFTADAAHELRGPLTALRSNATASLRDDTELAAPHRKRIETIAATANAMSRTVEDLLLLARAETPLERELFAVELGDRIVAAVDARRALAVERRIELDVKPFRARVYGNPGEIERIVGNLIDNALRYTNAEGAVSVDGVTERGGISVRVRDTGIGIAATDLPRIFDRFWRADGVRGHDGGTGLGLAIALALARRHGGDVTVKSTVGTGSVFSVWFPLRPPGG